MKRQQTRALSFRTTASMLGRVGAVALLAGSPLWADVSNSPYAKGAVVLGPVETECADSFVLDGVNVLCELFEGKPCAPVTSTCRAYHRQIFTGADFFPWPTPQWNGMGGSGKLIADSLLCSLRELSPQLGGPITDSVEIDLGLGTFRATQEIGFKDFKRINPVFNGYRKIVIDMPVVGKADAVTQNVTLTRVHHSTLGGSPAITGDSFAINVSTQTKVKEVLIEPFSFPVLTPLGVFSATPTFGYDTAAPVIAAPYDLTFTDVPEFLGGANTVRYTDVFGRNAGLEKSLKPVQHWDYPNHQTGWISQLGLGSRGPLPGTPVWAAPSGPVVVRPDLDLRHPRNAAEAVPSLHVLASARLEYPDHPSEILPEWVFSLPFSPKIDAYVTVTPTIEAGVGGQFNIAASEGSDHRETREHYVVSRRFAASSLTAGLNAAASFRIDVGLVLFVEAEFPWPVGTVTFINVNETIPIPVTGNKISTPTRAAASWSTGMDDPETLDHLKTFHTEHAGPGATAAFLKACFDPQQPPPSVPPATKPEKHDPIDLFGAALWPCNICLSTPSIHYDGTADPAWGNSVYDLQADNEYLLPATEEPKTWKCNMPRKNGCRNMCKFNKETKELTIERTPDQIASGLPPGDPRRAFFLECKSDLKWETFQHEKP